MELEKLSRQCWVYIFDCLSINDIFCNFALVKKSAHTLTQDHHLILQILRKRITSPMITGYLFKHPTTSLLGILKNLISTPMDELPFFGVKSNTGASNSLSSHWIQKCFSSNGLAPHCRSGYPQNDLSKISRNLNVEGSLSKLMTSIKYVKDNLTSGKHELINLNRYFAQLGLWALIELNEALGMTTQAANTKEDIEITKRNIETVVAKNTVLETLLRDKSQPQEVDMFDDKDVLYGHIGIIKGLKLFRPPIATCPVNSLCLFTSMKRFDHSNVTIESFNNLDSAPKFVEFYNTNRSMLPQIFETNIPELTSYAVRSTSFENVYYVLFKSENLDHNRGVYPMAWIYFNDTPNDNFQDKFELLFSELNYFQGVHVLLKMIAPLRTYAHTRQGEPIEIGYCSLVGNLVEKKSLKFETLLDVMKKINA
jgi:hypothetical protein